MVDATLTNGGKGEGKIFMGQLNIFSLFLSMVVVINATIDFVQNTKRFAVPLLS